MPSSPDTWERASPPKSTNLRFSGWRNECPSKRPHGKQVQYQLPSGGEKSAKPLFQPPSWFDFFFSHSFIKSIYTFQNQKSPGSSYSRCAPRGGPSPAMCPAPQSIRTPHTQHVLSAAALSSPVLSSFSIAHCSWWHLHPAKQPRSPVSFSTPLRNQIMNSVSL